MAPTNKERLQEELFIAISNLEKLKIIDRLLRDILPDDVIVTKKEIKNLVIIINNRIKEYNKEIGKLWQMILYE